MDPLVPNSPIIHVSDPVVIRYNGAHCLEAFHHDFDRPGIPGVLHIYQILHVFRTLNDIVQKLSYFCLIAHLGSFRFQLSSRHFPCLF